MSKKIPVLVISACLMWFAYQARDFLLELYWNLSTIYIDTGQKFINMGSGQTVVLDMPRGFISKPYAIDVKTEIIGGMEMSIDEMREKRRYPKHFLIKVSKIPFLSNRKTLISENVFKSGDFLYGVTSWGALNEGNVAFSETIYARQLPPGKYIFEIKDLTSRSPEHDKVIVYLEGTLQTSIK